MCSNQRCKDHNREDEELCEECHKSFLSKKSNSLICSQCNTIYRIRRKWKDEEEVSINGLCSICEDENRLRGEEFYKKNPHLRKKE